MYVALKIIKKNFDCCLRVSVVSVQNSRWRRSSTGIDFMKLDFGYKVLGQVDKSEIILDKILKFNRTQRL
jgi:hypothetical protein